AVRDDVAEHLALDEVRALDGIAVERRRLLEEGRDARVLRDDVGRVRGELHLGDEALSLLARELRHLVANAIDERVVEDERREIRLGEITVILRGLFAAERERLAVLLVPPARLLHDSPARLEHRL